LPETLADGAVAQLGERRPCKAEVVGSIPICSTRALADLVRRWFHEILWDLRMVFDNRNRVTNVKKR
jgi:hypothetical protein